MAVDPRRPAEAVVVGAGLMGRWHAEAVRRAGARVVAVIDRDPLRAGALAARHAGARVVRSLTEAATRDRIVHVCTPVDSHARVAEAALDAGCHVIVEKPLAACADDVAGLLERARDGGRLLVPVHQYLFQHGVAEARRALPALGRVLHVDAVACTAGADGGSDAQRDRTALEVLPHPLSLLADLLHPAVDEVAWAVTHPAPGELRVVGALAGASVALLVSTRGRPTRHGLQLVCTGGTLRLDLFHGYGVLVRGRATRAFKIAHPFVDATRTLTAAAVNLAVRAARRETAYPGLDALVARVYAAVDGGETPIGARETLAVARALDVIRAGMSPPTSAVPVRSAEPRATAST